MVYDITSRKSALQTLQDLTGFSCQYWDYEIYKYQKLHQSTIAVDTVDILNDIMERHNLNIDNLNLNNLEVYFFHVTTSNNACEDYYKYGMLNLQSVYSNTDTELRRFLDEEGIYVDLEGKTITVDENVYSISTDKGITIYAERKKNKGFYVGNKFYDDFNICGFFCFDKNDPYGGNVDKRPEILNDILKFTRYDICKVWENSHDTYIIKVKVNFREISPYFSNEKDDSSLKHALLRMAFDRYYYIEDLERICILHKNVSVDSSNILYAFRHDFDRGCMLNDNVVNFKGKRYGVTYSENNGEYIAVITLENMKHISAKAATKEMVKFELDNLLFELEEKAEARKHMN